MRFGKGFQQGVGFVAETNVINVSKALDLDVDRHRVFKFRNDTTFHITISIEDDFQFQFSNLRWRFQTNWTMCINLELQVFLQKIQLLLQDVF
jgi:hypothetical protein